LVHTLQVLHICTLCYSTNINTIIEFVPHVTGYGFSGGSDSYLQFRDTHAPCLLKVCIPPSNGIVRWWLFPEFGAELPLDNCTPTSCWITLYIHRCHVWYCWRVENPHALFVVIPWGAQIIQRSRQHLKILGTRRVKCFKCHTRSCLASLQNLIVMATLRPEFVHPLFAYGLPVYQNTQCQAFITYVITRGSYRLH